MINKLKRFAHRHANPIISIIVIFAACLNAFGVKVFMHPLNTIPAGTTGVSVLFSQLMEKFLHLKFEYYIVYLILNLVIAIWGWIFVSKALVKRSLLFIVTFTIVSKFLPTYFISDDKFVNIVSGGICNGVSNAILLFVGASSGGFDFLGLYLSKLKKKSYMGIVNMSINVSIISIAALIFGFERGIMSIIIVFINSSIIDRYHNQSNYVTLLIVTNKPNLFTEYCTERMKRTATIINSVGSYSQKPNFTIVTTMSKYKFAKVKKELLKVDPKAHITILNVNQVIGNMKSFVGKSAI